MKRRLEVYFEFAHLETNWRTEILAGCTTFITMAYIIFVNPSILQEAGLPYAAVMAATCLSASFGCIVMGVWARYPIALAPGMGLNAYFAYSVVKGAGVAWQTALGAVFLSGVAFLILTAAGVRQLIVKAIPADLYAAVASGIGLFIAFIGFRNSGLVAADQNTLVRLGDLHRPETLLSLFGLLLTGALLAYGVRAAMLLGVLGTIASGALVGLVHWTPVAAGFRAVGGTAFHLDIGAALRLGFAEIIFVFLFVDLFDNVGTLVALSKRAGLMNSSGEVPRLSRILFADATATIAGSLAGTSTVVSYIESAAGITAGGRSGVASVVTGLLFLCSLVLAPLVGSIPSAATAPALILVGSLMMSHVQEIDWSDVSVAVPSFLTMLSIPLTFSIANGLAFGFTAYTLLRLARGQWRSVNTTMYVLTALFLIRFYFLRGHS